MDIIRFSPFENDIRSLLSEHGPRAYDWRIDYDTWVGMLQSLYRDMPFLKHEFPTLETMYGMRVMADAALPPGTIELRDRTGEVLGRIENVKHMDAQQAPRREAPAKGNPKLPVATWPTTRLACRACGDTPPVGAVFCIACGKRL